MTPVLKSCLLAATGSLVLLSFSRTGFAQSSELTAPPRTTPLTAKWATDLKHEPTLTHDQKLKLLREHIKYVFVLFQENRSFDFYFGTYPGAEGLFSHPATEIAGYDQPIVDTDGTLATIHPFKIRTRSRSATRPFRSFRGTSRLPTTRTSRPRASWTSTRMASRAMTDTPSRKKE